MNSVVEQYGRRPQRTEPAVPPVPQRPQHPAPNAKSAADALAFMASINDDNAALQAENARLRGDLNLQMMRTRDLERDLKTERLRCEQYRVYAVTIRTLMGTIMESCHRANDAAIEASEQPPLDDKVAQELIDKTERELREVAAADIAAKFGPKPEPEVQAK